MPRLNRATPRAKSAARVHDIPLDQIIADPEQPRRTFEPGALRELANSIRANGLLQPITVRSLNNVTFMIVAGERRFRACQLIEAETIPAIVIEPPSQADVRVAQIIENDVRADVSPLEQARSYQALMNEAGWSVEELAARIGKAPHRITERTVLLKLEPEYQDLLAKGQLKPSEAYELKVIAVRKTNPDRAGYLADLLRVMQADMRRIETALREAAIQADFLSVANTSNAPTTEIMQ